MYACVPNETLMTIAILHDIVEDTEVAVDEIKTGFGTVVAEAVDAVSKRDSESYREYIDRVSRNKLALQVKLEDLRDNSRPSRMHAIPTWMLQRYSRARLYLTVRRSNV